MPTSAKKKSAKPATLVKSAKPAKAGKPAKPSKHSKPARPAKPAKLAKSAALFPPADERASTAPFMPRESMPGIHHPHASHDNPVEVLRSLIQRHLVSTLARHAGSRWHDS